MKDWGDLTADQQVRLLVGVAVEEICRKTIEAQMDPMEAGRAMARSLRDAAEQLERAVAAHEAAGGDGELAAVLLGQEFLTPEQTQRWLAGESLLKVMRDQSQEGP